ncbi:J domain-containing protein [Marinobacterium litorale]|uniref:J domain-containing protein n=1 Tax=Marinobacterium litorale TaxID=404770 RepID=UPI0003FD8412|nr:J domain-containing protein [Marinobacterium litorale]
MSGIGAATDEEYWVIWNGEMGAVDTVTIGCVETTDSGRNAWLDEPYDMVGPISLDELEHSGRIHFAACMVMSRQRWQADQVVLRQESIKLRREAQRRAAEAFARFNERRMAQPSPFEQYSERKHRELLKLPVEGHLKAKEIKTAYRRLAQKAHPDTGGTQEQFVRITEARDALLAAAS